MSDSCYHGVNQWDRNVGIKFIIDSNRNSRNFDIGARSTSIDVTLIDAMSPYTPYIFKSNGKGPVFSCTGHLFDKLLAFDPIYLDVNRLHRTHKPIRFDFISVHWLKFYSGAQPKWKFNIENQVRSFSAAFVVLE